MLVKLVGSQAKELRNARLAVRGRISVKMNVFHVVKVKAKTKQVQMHVILV
jgi:hypothetical protein